MIPAILAIGLLGLSGLLLAIWLLRCPAGPNIRTYVAGRNIAQGQLVMRGKDGKAYPMTTKNHDKMLFLGRSETAADLGQDIRIRIER